MDTMIDRYHPIARAADSAIAVAGVAVEPAAVVIVGAVTVVESIVNCPKILVLLDPLKKQNIEVSNPRTLEEISICHVEIILT